MKQTFLLILLIIISIKSFSQVTKVSLELNYPEPIDENFIGKNYKGIVDFGLKYRFTNLDFLNIGASLNASILKNSKGDRFQPFEVTSFSIQPRLFTELHSKTFTKFHPSTGLGYTFMIFNASEITNFDPENSDTASKTKTESGINLNLGMAFDITNTLFAQVQYDFVKINLDKNIPDIKYNTNVSILKIGLGYRL